MAKQIHNIELIDELFNDHKSYYYWLCEKSGLSGELALIFFKTDFRWKIQDDENRAKSALNLRDDYAREVTSDEDIKVIDKVKKSVIGDACCFEVFLSLAKELNDMLNLEQEDQTKKYFSMLMDNAKFSLFDDEDYDLHSDNVIKYWNKALDRVLDRTYKKSGDGGLFPLKSEENEDSFDQRERSLWAQLNDYADQIFESEEPNLEAKIDEK